jgi:hypothetical protein
VSSAIDRHQRCFFVVSAAYVTDTKNQFLKIKKYEPRSRPAGPRSKPTVVGPRCRFLGGALTHAAVKLKEAVIVDPSGLDLGPAPWSHRRSTLKEAVPVTEGSSGAPCVARPSKREAWVHVAEGSSAEKALSVLAGPPIPAACKVHTNMEKER